MACNEIVSLSDLQLALGSTGTQDVGLLTSLAAAASAAVETYCGREFASSAKTEFYTGNGYPSLPLRRRPITVMTSIYVDINRVFGSDTLLTQGTNYVVDWVETGLSKSGIVMLLQWPYNFLQAWPLGWGTNPSWGGLTGFGRPRIGWPVSPGCIKVTYTAGYTTIPPDLKAAGVQIACWMANFQATGGMIQTGSYIDVSTSFTAAIDALGSGAVPALGSARDILSRYKAVPWPTGG